MNRLRGVLAVSALLLVLAACGRSGGSVSRGAAPGQNLASLAHQLGQCIRAHGLPGFADPSIGSDGQIHVPASAPRLPASAETACRSMIDQLPDTGPTAAPPVSSTVFRQWLAFARCMRTHGLPDFPDPNPDGSFTLPADIVGLPNGAIRPEVQACRSLSPNGIGKFQGREA